MTKKNKNFSILAYHLEAILTQKSYLIGTRGSLLALTQCGQIKDQLEKITGDKFELKVIKTQGDQIVDKPLWQLEGKDFFTKELDEQLLAGEIDLVVHSYKDLGSVRPDGITLAAVTKRDFANDILLIKNETIAKLSSLEEIIVGTSSPRRIVNLEESLHEFLPNLKDSSKIKTKMLRGNVNSRIQKLKDDQYHAIVLAMPGVERLALTESSKIKLTKLVEGLNFMILPSSEFPAAASQGALGIECLASRDDQGELLSKLKKLEDKETVSEIIRERQAFAAYGGGCHLAVGINVQKIGDYYIHTHKGSVDGKKIFEKKLEGSFQTTDKKSKAFIGIPKIKLEDESFISCQLISKRPTNISINQNENVYITSDYVSSSVEYLQNKTPQNLTFCAGIRTWKKMARKGIWIHGSSDSLGEKSIIAMKESKFVQLINSNAKNNIQVLTSKSSNSLVGEIVCAYEKDYLDLTEDYKKELIECDVFFWTSFDQYQYYMSKVPEIKNAFHGCGLGKTYEQFSLKGIGVRPFASMDEFRTWFKN